MKVRYGLIGLGNVAENRIVREGFAFDRKRFRPLDEIELAGVCDLNKAKKAKAEDFGIPWFDTPEELFAYKDIDAVLVATENASHYALAKAAMEAGKHCLLEKPMTVNHAEALELRKTAETKNLSLSVDHAMRHNAYTLLSRSLLAGGRIGEVRSLSLHMEMDYGRKKTEADSWRCSKPEALGGPLGDLGSHCLYTAEFLLESRIVELAAVYYPRTLDITVENGAYVTFRAERGTEGSIRVSFASPRGGLYPSIQSLGYEAYGTAGTLRSYTTMYQLSGHKDEPVRVYVEVEDAQGVERYDLAEDRVVNIYQSSLLEHARSVASRKYLNGEEGVRNILLIEKAHESARENGSRKWM